MFRSLNPATWEGQTVLTIITFLFTLGVFLFFFLRALRMKRKEAERMSRLPVDDD
jgi:preprotein translocase subunit YajC